MEYIIRDMYDGAGKFFCVKDLGKHYLYLNRNGLWEEVAGPASNYYFSAKLEIQQILQRQQ